MGELIVRLDSEESLTQYKKIRTKQINENLWKETNEQKSSLEEVQGNTDGEGNEYKFGGVNVKSDFKRAWMFGRTASSVFRMVMLDAVGIDPKACPKFGPIAMKRNENNLSFEVVKGENNESDESASSSTSEDPPKFKLIEDMGEKNITEKEAAIPYYSEYDCMFPPSLIQHAVFKNLGKTVSFKKTMLIFRRNSDSPSEPASSPGPDRLPYPNFDEVIEIITDAKATMYKKTKSSQSTDIKCSVDVTCTRSTITKECRQESILSEPFCHIKEEYAVQDDPRKKMVSSIKKEKVKHV